VAGRTTTLGRPRVEPLPLASAQRILLGLLQLALWSTLLGFAALLVLPRVSSFDVLIVRGGSMEPTIHLGSIVLVDRSSRSPAVGTATAFRDGNGAIVTHRVISIDTNGFETKGDANAKADLGRRSPNQVYGTVTFSVPFVGYLLHLLHQPIVFLLLLFGTGGVLILGELQTIWREITTNRRRKATHAG
jgi:signal peptidase I